METKNTNDNLLVDISSSTDDDDDDDDADDDDFDCNNSQSNQRLQQNNENSNDEDNDDTSSTSKSFTKNKKRNLKEYLGNDYDNESQSSCQSDSDDDSVVLLEVIPAKNKISTVEKASFECPICWDPFVEIIGTSRFVVITQCCHKFCDRCLMEWQGICPSPLTCPMCRTQMDPSKIVSAGMNSNLSLNN